jgi:hypothetical protein
VLVRDVRWLIQLAQSPATDDLGAYFVVAQKIAETLPPADRIALHKAGVRMAGGHLRSQIRAYSTQRAVPLDDASVVLSTRNSNALDFALLIQDLVPLLEAYEHACHTDDSQRRLELADVICQGVSPDPELFVNRTDLLGAYSMIEDLFLTTAHDGQVVFTPVGQRHVRLIQAYQALIDRVSTSLHEDCLRFRPIAGAYSPYGIIYGFSSDLLEHIALRMLVPDAVTRFSMEDVFTHGDAGKLAWVSGWRQLPHLDPEVVKRFDYPQQFAEGVFNRIERELLRHSDGETNTTKRTGRLFIAGDDHLEASSELSSIPDLPISYIASSDSQRVDSHQAVRRNDASLLSEQREGKCLVSYKTAGGRTTITKDVLTEVLGAGDDATVAGLPSSAVDALKLLYPELIALPEDVPAG